MSVDQFKQGIDFSDSKNYGKPEFFDLNHYLDSVEQMICADEIIFALKMLDNLPGYYRDPQHYPQRAKRIKSTIYKNLMLPMDYAKNDAPKDLYFTEKMITAIETVRCQPRGQIIAGIVKQFNDQNTIPQLIEFGPWDYWLPIGLKYNCKLDFEYFPLTLDDDTLNKVITNYSDIHFGSIPDPSKFSIYVCCEVIEHMTNPQEILDPILKLQIDPHVIVISCPLYTLAGGMPNWDTRELGHIRTYTPKELLELGENLFPGRKWTHIREFSQVIVGIKGH